MVPQARIPERDRRPVQTGGSGVAAEEVDDDFLPDARDLDAAKLDAGPGGTDTAISGIATNGVARDRPGPGTDARDIGKRRVVMLDDLPGHHEGIALGCVRVFDQHNRVAQRQGS